MLLAVLTMMLIAMLTLRSLFWVGLRIDLLRETALTHPLVVFRVVFKEQVLNEEFIVETCIRLSIVLENGIHILR